MRVETLRFKTYLAPSIPTGLYEITLKYLEQELGVRFSLQLEKHVSGPPKDEPDPFATNKIDIGHFCAPPYIWLAAKEQSPVELLPVVPQFDDLRTKGEPVYFSDVIVLKNRGIKKFSQLKGLTWSYNDAQSLSGYFCALQKLAEMGEKPTFFSRVIEGGGHWNSMSFILDKTIDASAIDSNVLLWYMHIHPEFKEKIDIIDTWGPFPIQPIVIKKSLPLDLKKNVAESLLRMHENEHYKELLEKYLVKKFIPISDKDFDVERNLLDSCKHFSF